MAYIPKGKRTGGAAVRAKRKTASKNKDHFKDASSRKEKRGDEAQNRQEGIRKKIAAIFAVTPLD